jgi:hypothetical protein
VLDFDPRGGTAGEIISIDDDTVTVEIFEGLPHFDGMKCYSANSWNLESKTLKRVPPLTKGVDAPIFDNLWESVPDRPDGVYEITGMPFVDQVSVGEGLSWHFNVNTGQPNIRVTDTRDVAFENITVHNAIKMAILGGGNHNLSFDGLTITPNDGHLSVGPRDGCLINATSGEFALRDSSIDGVRWDPLNLRSSFCEVETRKSNHRIEIALAEGRKEPIEAPGTARFYVGNDSIEREFEVVEYVGQGSEHTYEMSFSRELPPAVDEDAVFVLDQWSVDEGTIQRNVFENNCGTAILCQNENITIQDNTFDRNTYANIALGPINHVAGGFARNVTIEGNTFRNSTWVNKHDVLPGTISTYQAYGSRDLSRSNKFARSAYNHNIEIHNNAFIDIKTAISIHNARDVTASGNDFDEVETRTSVNEESTRSITVD